MVRTKYVVVLVTAPNLKVARRLSRSVLNARLAACTNIVPHIESQYWWKGNLETASEVLLIFKTTNKALPYLERHVIEHHPYETPEFIALSLSGGTPRYLRWLSDSVVLRMGKTFGKSR